MKKIINNRKAIYSPKLDIFITLFLWKPLYGALALVLLSPIVAPQPQSIDALEILFIFIWVLTFLNWLFRYFISPRWYKNSLNLPLFTLFLLCMASFFLAKSQGTSTYSWLRGFVPFLNILMFFLFLDQIKSKNDVEQIANVIRITTFIYFVANIYILLKNLGFRIPTSPWEIRAAYADLAKTQFSVLCMMFTYALWLRQARKKDLLLFFLPLTISLTVGIRGALLPGFILFIITLYSIKLKHIKFLMGFTWVSVALVSLFALLFSQIIGILFENIYSLHKARTQRFIEVGDVRVLETKVVLENFKETPIFGKGLGFVYSYSRSPYLPGKTLIWEGRYTHNIFTFFMLDFGIIGVLLLMWLIIATVKEYIITKIKLAGNPLFDYTYAAGLALLGTLMYSLLEAIVNSTSFWLTTTMLMAIVIKSRFLKGNQR